MGKYSEGASRTLYTKYTEYKKRVAHANAGGAIFVSQRKWVRQESNPRLTFVTVYRRPIKLPGSQKVRPTGIEPTTNFRDGL